LQSLEPVEKLLSLALVSGYLKEKKKLSVLLVSPVGCGKTEVLKRFTDCPFVYTVNQATRFGLVEDILPTIKSGMKINHVILPALESVIDGQYSIVTDTIHFLNALIEDGVYRIKTYYLDHKFSPPAQCGILTATTDKFLGRRRVLMNDFGFFSRFIIFSYSYDQKTGEKVRTFLKQGRNIDIPKIMVQPPKHTNIECGEECFVPFESYINHITETLGSSEYRTIDHLRILLKSSAALDGRDTVNIKDIALISELTKWMNLDYNPMGDLSEG